MVKENILRGGTMNLKEHNYNSKIKVYNNKDKITELANFLIEFVYFDNLKNKIKIETIKDNYKGCVYRIEFKNENYFVKVYSYDKFKKIIKNLFRPVRSVRILKTISKLQENNIPVIEPSLGVVNKRSFLKKDSIFVSKEFEGVNLREYIEKENLTKKERIEIIKKMGCLWGKLLNNNFIHQDPGLKNFMYNKKNKKIVLIDLDNIYYSPITIRRFLFESLARFYDFSISDFRKSNNKYLDSKERKLFLKYFLKNYKLDMPLKDFIYKINDLVIKRLIRSNKLDLLDKDDLILKIKYNNN